MRGDTLVPFLFGGYSPLSHIACAAVDGFDRGIRGASSRSPSVLHPSRSLLPEEATGPTHDLVRTPAFGSSEVSFHIPGSLSSSLKILGIIPKE